MRKLFEKIKIKTIEFESSINEVSVYCEISTRENKFNTELIVSFSDLNRLLGRIQNATNELNYEDVSSLFEKQVLENGEEYYSFSTKNSAYENLEIDYFEFEDNTLEIRA